MYWQNVTMLLIHPPLQTSHPLFIQPSSHFTSVISSSSCNNNLEDLVSKRCTLNTYNNNSSKYCTYDIETTLKSQQGSQNNLHKENLEDTFNDHLSDNNFRINLSPSTHLISHHLYQFQSNTSQPISIVNHLKTEKITRLKAMANNPYRDPKMGPLHKVTIDLIHTYKHINEVSFNQYFL